ncbi:MAG TPA: hypothetical protein VGK11_02420 [Actinomycetota bacterium]
MQAIPSRPGLDLDVGVGCEEAAKRRDVHLDGRPGRPRWLLRPQEIEQGIEGNERTRAHKQRAEDDAELRAADGERLAVALNLQRPEDPEA